jgi:hypothetical protein
MSETLTFELVFLVIGILGTALGLFLWRDIAPKGSMYRSVRDEEVSGCGLQLAVVAGLVTIISLIAVGYGVWKWLTTSN